MIRAKGLTVQFDDTTVVRDVSFELAEGGSLALWGSNGAGKTTILRALLGLIPFGGQVTVAGHDVSTDGRGARAAAGYVPQQLAFYDDMSAFGFLGFLAALRRAPDDQPAALLARVGLAEHSAKPVGALSGGMRQRLALAAALLGDPPVLVLDEPTANLDAAARSGFLSLLLELRAAGKTLLVTSHRVDEVSALADDVLMLVDGAVRARGTPAELTEQLAAPGVLRLVVPPESVDAALAVLADEGFDARRNGRGVTVEVTPGRRAAPVRTLLEAGVPVEDLMLEERTWTLE